MDGQNAHTRALLDARPGRGALRERLTALLSIGVIGVPEPRSGRRVPAAGSRPPGPAGDRYFHVRRDGRQDQPVLYVREGLRGTDRALVDPNRMSADGTTAIDWWFPSEEGALVAYGVSAGGDEKSTLRIVDVGTGKRLPDVIPDTRYCSLAWLAGGSGFYYTRYPAAGTVPAGQENYHRHLFFHRLGDDPARDAKVFGDGRRPEDLIDVRGSEDGRHLVVQVMEGWARSDLFVKDLRDTGAPLVPIAVGLDAIFTGETLGDTLYLLTNWKAPRYRLVAVDLARPSPENWRDLIPESDAVLSQAVLVQGGILALSMRDASSRLALHDRSGRKVRDIPLPALGTVDRVSGRHDAAEAFFGFSSYTLPPAVHRYETGTGRLSVWEKVEADVDLSGLEIRQVFFPSRDGTRLSMFLAHRRGLARDGGAAAILYGYGGFNISQTPGFSRALVLWLERGGVYAEANLRGGGEYGEAWHRAGMLGSKQNVFDDFIAAGEWLVANGYTRPERLAIMGGSNGGLLVGAALTQRPELFRAVVCRVPLLDMVRYHRFQIAALWIPEYGSADSPEQFRWLHAYSPYHRIREGTEYPAVFLETAESDTRVDPMHARKMAARLQAASTSGRPILLRIESKAGHGVGKPLTKQIETAVDTWAFLLWQLGLEEGAAARQARSPRRRRSLR